jgi:broad specificity phosphatase PhoE
VGNPGHKASHGTLGRLLTVHFIRHGQAGSRHDYDRLSDVGREQAGRLGSWFARRGVRFDAAWSGRLARQRETAQQVRESARCHGLEFPEASVEACWDEFDLDAVYRSIGPQIARHDEEFRRQFEELKEQARDCGSAVHRRWAPCDTTVVRAWVEGRYPFDGESFEAFVERVRGGASLFHTEGNVAVFTSATPAAVWAAMALDLDARRIMQLAGVTYNTGMTVVRVDGERIRLFQFNTAPHIDTAELLTHR